RRLSAKKEENGMHDDYDESGANKKPVTSAHTEIHYCYTQGPSPVFKPYVEHSLVPLLPGPSSTVRLISKDRRNHVLKGEVPERQTQVQRLLGRRLRLRDALYKRRCYKSEKGKEKNGLGQGH